MLVVWSKYIVFWLCCLCQAHVLSSSDVGCAKQIYCLLVMLVVWSKVNCISSELYTLVSPQCTLGGGSSLRGILSVYISVNMSAMLTPQCYVQNTKYKVQDTLVSFSKCEPQVQVTFSGITCLPKNKWSCFGNNAPPPNISLTLSPDIHKEGKTWNW